MRRFVLPALLYLFCSGAQSLKLHDGSQRFANPYDRVTYGEHDVQKRGDVDARDGWEKWTPIPSSPACAPLTVTVTQIATSVYTTTVINAGLSTVTTTVTNAGISTVTNTATAIGTTTATVTVTDTKGGNTTVTESGREFVTVLLISTTTVATTTTTTTETITSATVTITTPGPGVSASITITRIKYDATHITLIQVSNTAIPPGQPVFNICAANSTIINNNNNSSSASTSNTPHNSTSAQTDSSYDGLIIAYRTSTPWWAVMLIVLLILFGLLILAALAMLLFGKSFRGPPACAAIPPGTCGSCGESCSSCVCEKLDCDTPPIGAACVPPRGRSRPSSPALLFCHSCGQRHEFGLCGYLGMSRRSQTGYASGQAYGIGHRASARASADSLQLRRSTVARAAVAPSTSSQIYEVEQSNSTAEHHEINHTYNSVRTHSQMMQMAYSDWYSKSEQASIASRERDNNATDDGASDSSVKLDDHVDRSADDSTINSSSKDETTSVDEQESDEARVFRSESVHYGGDYFFGIGSPGRMGTPVYWGVGTAAAHRSVSDISEVDEGSGSIRTGRSARSSDTDLASEGVHVATNEKSDSGIAQDHTDETSDGQRTPTSVDLKQKSLKAVDRGSTATDVSQTEGSETSSHYPDSISTGPMYGGSQTNGKQTSSNGLSRSQSSTASDHYEDSSSLDLAHRHSQGHVRSRSSVGASWTQSSVTSGDYGQSKAKSPEIPHGDAQEHQGQLSSRVSQSERSEASDHRESLSSADLMRGSAQARERNSLHPGVDRTYTGESSTGYEKSLASRIGILHENEEAQERKASSVRFGRTQSNEIAGEHENSFSHESSSGDAQAHDRSLYRGGMNRTYSSATSGGYAESSSSAEMGHGDIHTNERSAFGSMGARTYSSTSSEYGEVTSNFSQTFESTPIHESRNRLNENTYVVGREVFERRTPGKEIISTTQLRGPIRAPFSRSRSSKKFGPHVSVAEVSDEELEGSDTSSINASGDAPQSRIRVTD